MSELKVQNKLGKGNREDHSARGRLKSLMTKMAKNIVVGAVRYGKEEACAREEKHGPSWIRRQKKIA